MADAKTQTIARTDSLEVIRIVMPAGKDIAPHAVNGEITVQCLEGSVDFSVAENEQRLTAGSWLYLQGGTEHALHANEDSALLVTILLRR